MKIVFLLIILLPLTVKAQPLPDYCPAPLELPFYGNWYPYMYKENGIYKGTDWEFLQTITDALGCKVQVVVIPEKRAHKDLSKRHNLVMSAATITESRLKHAYFSKSYRAEVQSIFYLESREFPPNLASLEYIVSKSSMIAINGAAYYGKRVEAQRNGKFQQKFIHVPGMKKRIEMIRLDRAQAMVEDYIAGCNYFHQYGQDMVPKLRTVTVNRVNVSYMFSKYRFTPRFVALFDQAMEALLKQGVHDDMVARYTPIGC